MTLRTASAAARTDLSPTAQPDRRDGASVEHMSACHALAFVLRLAPPEGPSEGPAEAPDPFTTPSSTAPAEPLDDERPESSGLGLERQRRRLMEDATGLDLSGAWEDYEEDYKEEGERRDFSRYTRQRFADRRGAGIGVTVGGLALTGGSSIFWIYVVGESELYREQAIFAVIGVGVTAIGVATTGVGAWLWSRNQKRLNALRDGGYLASGRRLRLQAVAPVVLRGGGGLGLRLAF